MQETLGAKGGRSKKAEQLNSGAIYRLLLEGIAKEAAAARGVSVQTTAVQQIRQGCHSLLGTLRSLAPLDWK